MKTRPVQYPCVLCLRLTQEVATAIDAEARRRPTTPGELARVLIKSALPDVTTLSPIRRVRPPVQDAGLLAEAVAALGRISGNLQRIYVSRGEADAELIDIKAELRRVAESVHAALGTDRDQP